MSREKKSRLKTIARLTGLSINGMIYRDLSNDLTALIDSGEDCAELIDAVLTDIEYAVLQLRQDFNVHKPI